MEVEEDETQIQTNPTSAKTTDKKRGLDTNFNVSDQDSAVATTNTRRSKSRKTTDIDYSSMTNAELQYTIYRIQNSLAKYSVCLPGGGRDKLQAMTDELNRRRNAHSLQQLQQRENEKKQIDINFHDLFGEGHDKCDQEIVIVPSDSWRIPRHGKSRNVTENDFSAMPEDELQTRIDSNEKLLAKCSSKLPDGGAKLRDKLQAMKDELKRSQHSRSQELEQCRRSHWSHSALKLGLHGSCLLEICKVLRNSQFLEELTVHVNLDFFCDCNMLLQELASPCELHYLKVVTIRGFQKPCKTVVQLMEFLLKNVVCLDKLVIIYNKKEQLISTQGSEFILELLSLPRASKNARVVVD